MSSTFENPAENKQRNVSVVKTVCEETDNTNFLLMEQSVRQDATSRKSILQGADKNRMKFSTRMNTSYKWKQDLTVIGALEVQSEPHLDVRAKMIEKPHIEKEKEFAECMRVWEDLKLRKSFIEACESVPPTTSCCGLVRHHHEHVRELAGILNKGWAKAVNKTLKPKGLKISVFVWTWSNASGPGETAVMLIRFHSLRKPKGRISSTESSTSTVELSSEHPNSASSLGYCSSYKLSNSPVREKEYAATEERNPVEQKDEVSISSSSTPLAPNLKEETLNDEDGRDQILDKEE